MTELSALGGARGAVGGDRRLSRFMAVDCPYPLGRGVFYLGGGYKYAMAGEGMGFMHCPPGFGPRPPITGWYAEFGELTAPPGGGSATPGDALHGRDLRSLRALPL